VISCRIPLVAPVMRFTDAMSKAGGCATAPAHAHKMAADLASKLIHTYDARDRRGVQPCPLTI
jgi:hypothetical protein